MNNNILINNITTFKKFTNMTNVNAVIMLSLIKDTAAGVHTPGKNKAELTVNGLKTGVFFSVDPFTYGNKKLSKNIAVFSLLPVVTCLNCKNCKKDCYALKASRLYPQSFNKQLIYTYLAFNNINLLELLICNSLQSNLSKKNRPYYVRIHESGDFINQSYIDMWQRIAARFTEYKFYFYTKVNNIFNFKDFTALKNVNMVNSVLPDGVKNFDPLEKLLKRIDKIKKDFDMSIPLCPAIRNSNIHCGETCTACMHKKYVAFEKH